jgi:type II restriction/modification system DNA methylase subunit YeeA
METTKLRRFAQYARRTLLELVEARLQLVLMPESAARRETPVAVRELETQIRESSREQVIDRVAYTWFNRFCALRYMDVNRVKSISVVSPLDGQFQPEILAEAKMGHIDEEMVPAAIQAKVRALLDGTSPSPDPQQEAYRLLVVAACNYWQRAMPFLFEAIADYTELLMPDDLLSGNSVLAYTREAMTPDACQDVEVIGWLYQFYISEKKDAVFEGLKKNKKITPENIPAATQLFTPHWIVRYLVENSLGHLWLLNRPNSRLAEKMAYYIAPQEPVTDFLRIARPEDIKLCDPACGSGHMLTYAFDLLYAIYEEEGADPAEIPEKILTHNLFGIEIDERAAELAAFALTMKALQQDKRFFRRQATRGELVEPNICVLRPIKIASQDLDAYVAEVGRDLFTANLRTLLTQFEEADNFGSLIRPEATDYAEIRRVLAEKGIGNQLLLEHVHSDVLRVLEQAEYLSQRYQVVVANPPYMGGKGMNERLGAWAKDNYPDSKSDTFSMFMERGLGLVPKFAFNAMVTMESWMFLSSFEKLRTRLLNSTTIHSMVHMPYLGRGGTSMGINFGTAAFVSEKNMNKSFKGQFCCVRYFETNDDGVPNRFPPQNERRTSASTEDFTKIPGSPIAYWVSQTMRNAFDSGKPLHTLATPRAGMITGNNESFVRLAHEVSLMRIGHGCKSRKEASDSGKKWFPYQKGGPYRKYFGNLEYVVDWENDGHRLRTTVNEKGKVPAHAFNEDYIFKPNVNWSAVTSAAFSCRITRSGCLFDASGSAAFPEKVDDCLLLSAFLNSHIARELIGAINPTLNFQAWEIGNLPILPFDLTTIALIRDNTKSLYSLARSDWDSYEVSWDFAALDHLQTKFYEPCLDASYRKAREYWREMILEMQRLEEENNRIFIEAYGLQSELKPDVPLAEITLTCNPHYRYGDDKSEQELEDLLRADTMREFISYAVGCMFGRYSLDKPGLILANQGDTLEDYLRQVSEPRFMPDADNVIPLLDGDWFSDDITGRFREFLRVAFGDEHYDENLRFIESALGKKEKPLPIRDFFLKDFYTDHVKRYKKRPIYWLFSSGSGTKAGSFNALIYLHRYRPDTASVVLQYLRDFRSKLVSERDHQEQMSISTSASQGEKTKALKRIEELKKILVELDDYERDTLYPLATRQVALDLDDGVKRNYVELGAALKKIPGLDAKDEE